VANYQQVSLSPDERSVAAAIGAGSPPNVDNWTIDVARNLSSRLTFDPATDSMPVWSSDSGRVLFSSFRSAGAGLYQKAWTRTSDEELVLKGAGDALPIASDWSPDGRFIVYQLNTGASTATDLWIVPLSGDKKPFPYVQGPGSDTNAVFSPDGSPIRRSTRIFRRFSSRLFRPPEGEPRSRRMAARSQSGEVMARSCFSWRRTGP
jgi:eukaryotic-like serine/threonine-protein kinase